VITSLDGATVVLQYCSVLQDISVSVINDCQHNTSKDTTSNWVHSARL